MALEQAHLDDARVVDQRVELAERRHRGVDGTLPVGRLRHVEMHIDGVVTEIGGDLLAEVVEDVAEHDLRPLGHELARLRLTLAARRARDDRDPPLELAHAAPPVRRVTCGS